MKVSKEKIEIAMARACLNPYELCKRANMQYQSYRRLSNGSNCKPATVGKIAKALDCDVEDLIQIQPEA